MIILTPPVLPTLTHYYFIDLSTIINTMVRESALSLFTRPPHRPQYLTDASPVPPLIKLYQPDTLITKQPSPPPSPHYSLHHEIQHNTLPSVLTPPENATSIIPDLTYTPMPPGLS